MNALSKPDLYGLQHIIVSANETSFCWLVSPFHKPESQAGFPLPRCILEMHIRKHSTVVPPVHGRE